MYALLELLVNNLIIQDPDTTNIMKSRNFIWKIFIILLNKFPFIVDIILNL